MPAVRAAGRSRASGGMRSAEIARDHDVWVLTSLENRDAIVNALAMGPASVQFVFLDWPKWLWFMKRTRVSFEVQQVLLADRGVCEGSRAPQAGRFRSRPSRHGVVATGCRAFCRSSAFRSSGARLAEGNRRRRRSGQGWAFAVRCSEMVRTSRDSLANTIHFCGSAPGAPASASRRRTRRRRAC